MKKIINIFIGLIFILCVVIGGIAFSFVYKNYKELPNIEELVSTYSSPIPTEIYDRNGILIDRIYSEQREPIEISELSDKTKQAFISIEDKYFYSHNGINIKRILGALIGNVVKGRAAQGASTITQQLSKNAFLSNEKKLSRKMKEVIIAFELERMYTKSEILEKYLNEIYFGSGYYGIKSAAKNFFRKDVGSLNLAEAAMLAGIPNRPERYNPRKKMEESLKRTHLILREMQKDGFITKEEYDKAINNKFVIYKEEMDLEKIDLTTTTLIYEEQKQSESTIPDFTDLVVNFLKTEKDKNGELMFSEVQIYNQGLKVYTTVDKEIQITAKEVFEANKLLKSRKDLQAGMATIDPETGEVIAIIAGTNHSKGNFNRGTMARRQIGSTGKPFLYFSALEKGLEMNTVIEDAKIKIGTWEPKNYGGQYYGNVTLLEALDRSLNLVSVKLLQMIGIPAFKKTMLEFETNFNIPDNLTSSLGSYEGTPLELAQAYALFANGGYSVKPSIISKIEDNLGNIIYKNEVKKIKKYDTLEISLINYMLQSSVKNGTSRRATVRDKRGNPIAQGGKTGTTNENRTVWYAGITPTYVTTIYLGYDDNSPIKGNITGGSGPTPIWGEFYSKLVAKDLYKSKKFDFVENNIKNGLLVKQELDSKTGLISSKGREFLVRSGNISLEEEEKYKNGIFGVLNQGLDPTIEIKEEIKKDSLYNRILGI
ncbi:MAG: transglycosylase domain-containing protein [Fusobacteriaceae bacterium]